MVMSPAVATPFPFCRLFVKTVVYPDVEALPEHIFGGIEDNLRTTLFQTPAREMSSLPIIGINSSKDLAPEIVNLLVSLPYEACISALMRKVSADYRRKH